MMEKDRPLLIFPAPKMVARGDLFGRGSNIVFPGGQRQVQRLEPQFNALTAAFERRQAELSTSPLGVRPEQVLVLETAGTVEDFVVAVRRIKGMEWLSGLDEIDIDQDDDFKRPDGDSAKKIRGQLFLIMSNQAAMRELLSLWNRFRSNCNMPFPRGLAKWHAVFNQLKTIRYWDVDDRLRETGALEDWELQVKLGSAHVHVEIELWFKADSLERSQARAFVLSSIGEAAGQIVSEAVIPEIEYHAILCKLPLAAIVEFLLNREAKLLRCDHVMFFRPSGQISSPAAIDESFAEENRWNEFERDPCKQLLQPVVAVLDGLPLANHELLAGRLIIDDPEDWASLYQAAERRHGTGMASIIINGDLNIEQPPLERPVYARPVMKPIPNAFGSVRSESLPDDRLSVDLIHQAVIRMFEGPEAVARHVRVINFSIADAYVPFFRFMTPLARLIDWLSWKYNVLFVISAGNHGTSIVLDIPKSKFDDLQDEDRQNLVLQAVSRDARNRRILSPAESINALTVGAAHSDFSDVSTLGDRVDPIKHAGLCSPISAIGHGFRRAIKPDILMPAGKQLYSRRLDGSPLKTTLEICQRTAIPPGMLVATPGAQGERDKTIYTCGTSNAAAMATRTAAQLFEMLNELRASTGVEDAIGDEHIAVLLKTLLVHGADWGRAIFHVGESLDLQVEPSLRRSLLRNEAARLLGYGLVSPHKVFGCQSDRATLIGCGSIAPEEGQQFRLPLPQSLNGTDIPRRLVVSLGWFSPINFNHQKYRQARLWFEVENKVLAVRRVQADHAAARRGTIQHEIFLGDDVASFAQDGSIHIKVSCRADAGDFEVPVPYGLAVTLSAQGMPVYEEIEARVRVPMSVRSRTAS